MNNRIFRLQGKVQNYGWGGYDFIPEFLGLQQQKDKPFAEYWLGAHPSASSTLNINGKQEVLNELIRNEPITFIGEEVYKHFGELPYLLKVLDVRDMLSIQVHPTRHEAAKGFEAEEAAGIPINAAHRNYKDKNHKPEVMIALSEFWLLHGFKQQNELINTLNEVGELNHLLPVFEKGGYKGLYKHVMELEQSKVDEMLLPLIERELINKDQLTKDKPGYWVAKLYNKGEKIENVDKGIFSIYFFNIVRVQPAEAVFQGAGIPHAYLEGQNVELMANSDNVLRGGLTTKHVDVAELLKHTTFEGIAPNVMTGEKVDDVETVFECPVPDFGIGLIKLDGEKEYRHITTSAEIYLVAEGVVNVHGYDEYNKGEAFFVLPSTEVVFNAKGTAVIYKAYVPKTAV